MELDEYGTRSTDEVRERVMDLLATYYARGALELEEYETRVEAATRSQSRGELESLLANLPALPRHESAGAGARSAPDSEAAGYDVSVNAGDVRPSQTLASIFSGVSRRGEWYPARSTQVVAFFGGVDFGGVSIVVPPGVNVEVNGVGIFGAFDNKVPETRRGSGPTIRIDGLCVFGGTDVRQKKPKRG
jgi:hypothetical protein